MLTAESEGGQLKCHAYWKNTDFGPIKLRVLSETRVSLDVDKRRSPASTGTAKTTPATTAAAAATDRSTSPARAAAPDPFLPEGLRRRANTTTTLNPGTSSQPNQFNFPPQPTGPAETQYVIIRKFALTHAGHPSLAGREVTQLHYPSWPDFGAPAQPGHLLALVELANTMQRGGPLIDTPGALTSASLMWGSMAGPESDEPARPMLVHCSAGCGRTGAFCTVDSVIDMLKRQRQHILGPSRSGQPSRAPPGSVERDLDGDTAMGEAGAAPDGSDRNAQGRADIDTSWLEDDNVDLIAQTVEDFRGQRLSMVQSLRQFVLCYETVLEWIRRLQESAGRGPDGRGRGRSGSLAF